MREKPLRHAKSLAGLVGSNKKHYSSKNLVIEQLSSPTCLERLSRSNWASVATRVSIYWC